jgi:hypothetical protein
MIARKNQDSLVTTSTEASVELSEAELTAVTGGQTNKASGGQKLKGDTSDYLVVTLKEAFIS